MEQLISIKTAEELKQGGGAADLPPFDPAELIRHAPDAHWILTDGRGKTVGRCSLWWRSAPPYPGHRVGVIGHYAVRDATAAHRLLQHACEQLATSSCTLAVSPMDGNTWRRYRLIAERGSEPVFLLEPDNPDDWAQHFLDNRFAPLASYSSAINTDLEQSDPCIAEVAERAAAQGVRIRALDPGIFEDELHRIYAISTASFRNNLLYSPISEADFTIQYRAVKPYVRPELVLIAEYQGHPVGFLFSIPDLLQARRGQVINTVIIKTVAVVPERANAGLGSLLVARCQEIARALGYTRVIHALMLDTNNSRKISRHYARIMRRYALFARTLGP
jgi:GNAT superfamily N-acetyltransferase